jgi:DNA invertase Pin-like site-specific DNA recombinase
MLRVGGIAAISGALVLFLSTLLHPLEVDPNDPVALEEFKNLGIDFVSYQENIDTSSPLGSAIFTIISAVAQLERDIIAERVKAGLRRAKENGKKLGRPRAEVSKGEIYRLHSHGLSLRQIATQLNISKSTVARYITQS